MSENPPMPSDTALLAAVKHLLQKERAKHLPISIEGKICDNLLFNLDPALRADIIARKKAAIAAQKADLARRMEEINRVASDLEDIEAEDALLLTDGGSKPALDV